MCSTLFSLRVWSAAVLFVCACCPALLLTLTVSRMELGQDPLWGNPQRIQWGQIVKLKLWPRSHLLCCSRIAHVWCFMHIWVSTLGLSHGDHLPTTARSNIHTPTEAGGCWHLVFHCRSSPLKKHVPTIRFLWLYFCAATALPWDFCSFNYNLDILATHCLLMWRVNKYVEIEIKYAT